MAASSNGVRPEDSPFLEQVVTAVTRNLMWLVVALFVSRSHHV